MVGSSTETHSRLSNIHVAERHPRKVAVTIGASLTPTEIPFLREGPSYISRSPLPHLQSTALVESVQEKTGYIGITGPAKLEYLDP